MVTKGSAIGSTSSSTSEFPKKNEETKSLQKIALASIFATLFAIIRLIPTYPLLGVPGTTFPASDILAPIYGVILGPYVGGASVLLGVFLSVALGRPLVFLGLDFLPALCNTLAVGLLMRGNRILVLFFNIVLLAVFTVSPFTLALVKMPFAPAGLSVPFSWLHVVGIIVLASPLGARGAHWVKEGSVQALLKGLFIISLIGTLIQHLVGGLVFEWIRGVVLSDLDPEGFALLWQVIFWLYPIERIVTALIATVVGASLIKALRRMRRIPL
ncbi:MAG: hypothetical protein HY619_05290 [Thaumarchaeota archaeon]|nr:hypothetical protein [Nitrososphaerota archaeon]